MHAIHLPQISIACLLLVVVIFLFLSSQLNENTLNYYSIFTMHSWRLKVLFVLCLERNFNGRKCFVLDLQLDMQVKGIT